MQLHENDISLLAAAARGDKQAFERIYRAYKDDLITIAAFILRDRQAAEDVLHDVFVSFARRAGKLRLRGTLKGYLLTSCVNRARDLLRRQDRERLRSCALNDLPSLAAGPAEVAAIAQDSGRVRAALASLPAEQREVVSLHIHGRLKFREVAALLGISINTAQSRYRYALSALRAILAKEGDES